MEELMDYARRLEERHVAVPRMEQVEGTKK